LREPVACVVGVTGRGRVRIGHTRAAIERIVCVTGRLALSVRELSYVAGEIVLIALTPRQRIDTRRQPIHVVVCVSRRVAPRVGDAEEIPVWIVGEPGRTVQRIEQLDQRVQHVVIVDGGLPRE